MLQILTGLMVFFFPGSSEQLASGFSVSVLCLAIHLKTQPYNKPLLNRLQAVSLSTQSVILYYGQMRLEQHHRHQISGSDLDENGDVAMRAIITALNVAMVLLPVGLAVRQNSESIISTLQSWGLWHTPSQEERLPTAGMVRPRTSNNSSAGPTPFPSAPEGAPEAKNRPLASVPSLLVGVRTQAVDMNSSLEATASNDIIVPGHAPQVARTVPYPQILPVTTATTTGSAPEIDPSQGAGLGWPASSAPIADEIQEVVLMENSESNDSTSPPSADKDAIVEIPDS